MGFEVIGPFDSPDAADVWGEREFKGEPWWWVVPMASPVDADLSDTCECCGSEEACECTVAMTDLPMMGREMKEKEMRLPKLMSSNIEDIIPGIGTQLRVPGA